MNYDLDFLENFNDSNTSSKVNDDTNNGAITTDTNITNQDHQDYYNQRDQQYISYKYNRDLEQVTFELIPNINLEEEEEDGFHQCAD